MRILYLTPSESDFDTLVELRIEAMRESLEKIGRFDRDRSIERFRSSFVPTETRMIVYDNTLVGFYAVTHNKDSLHLGHLYVKPEFQCTGIGSCALKRVIELSIQTGLPIRLGALKKSRSNDFYQKHGFIMTSEDEWDTYYERPVSRE